MPSLSNTFTLVSQGLRILATVVPAIGLLQMSKTSVRHMLLWIAIAGAGIYSITFNQADSNNLIYIILFMLYFFSANPKDIFNVFWISVSLGIIAVILAWTLGFLPSQSSDGREYLGFYYTSFGPNLFLHAVLAYMSSRDEPIQFSRWLLIEAINIWFYSMTLTSAVFIVINLALVLYYPCTGSFFRTKVLGNKKIQTLIKTSPFLIAGLTIAMQYYYIFHSSSAMMININTALSNRPYFGKLAIEKYGISLFGQPIAWLTGTDGTKVSGNDYFYVDSSYLQVLVSYGIVMLVVLCLAMTIVQRYGISTRNAAMCLACTLFLIHCMTDPQLLSFRYDPFLIATFACIECVRTLTFTKRNHNE